MSRRGSSNLSPSPSAREKNKPVRVVQETPPKSAADLEKEKRQRLKNLREEQEKQERMIQYYKQSPRW
jgi:hypothetical protein